MFPPQVQAALQEYDRNKGLFRHLFGDAAAIAALRRLEETEQSNLLALCRCFFDNMPAERQASFRVWSALLEANQNGASALRELNNRHLLTDLNAATVLAHINPMSAAQALTTLNNNNNVTPEEKAVILAHANPYDLTLTLMLSVPYNSIPEIRTGLLVHPNPRDAYHALDYLYEQDLLTAEHAAAVLAHTNPRHLLPALVNLHDKNLLTAENVAAVLAHTDPSNLVSALANLHEKNFLTAENRIAVSAHANPVIAADALLCFQKLHNDIKEQLEQYHKKLKEDRSETPACTATAMTQEEANETGNALLALVNSFFDLIEKYDMFKHQRLKSIQDTLPDVCNTIFLLSKSIDQANRPSFYEDIYLHFTRYNLHTNYPEEAAVLFNCAPDYLRLSFYLILPQEILQTNFTLHFSMWTTLCQLRARDQHSLYSTWSRLFQDIRFTHNASDCILPCVNADLDPSDNAARNAMMETLFAMLTENEKIFLLQYYDKDQQSFKEGFEPPDAILAKLLAQWGVLLSCDATNVREQFPELDRMFSAAVKALPSQQSELPVWKSVFGISSGPSFFEKPPLNQPLSNQTTKTTKLASPS